MKKLKRIYDQKDQIPQGFETLYEENGEGKWALNVEIEGLTPSKRADEFRTTNIKLKQRLEAYEDAEFGNGEMTPERSKELVEKEKDFVAGNVKGKDEVEKLVTQRTEEMRVKFEKDKKALGDVNAELTGKLQKVSIEAKAVEAAIPFGLRKTAHEDLIDRVVKVFKVDPTTGEPVAYEADGKTPRYGADGERLTITDYVKGLANDSGKHLFEGNTGSDADPNKTGSRQQRGGGDGDTNPWADPINRTEQGNIIRTDPDRAIRLAKKAGVTLQISQADRDFAAANRGGGLVAAR